MPAKRTKSIRKTEDLFLMTPLIPKETGLLMKVWICVRPSKEAIPSIKVNTRKGDRVKPYEWVSVSVEEEPKILEKNLSLDAKDFEIVKRFIKANLKPILDHWNCLSDSGDLLATLKKV